MLGKRILTECGCVLVTAAAALLCMPGCLTEPSESPQAASAAPALATAPSTRPFERIVDKALPNAHRVTEKVYSGAQPYGEPGFARLQQLGVKTIISVDGAKPDVELARKYAMRYVHLPIGYGGVSAEQGMALAKAVGEMPGPIYVHCHHGMHRSAAAVAVACVLEGSLRPEQAESVLRTFGTSPNYSGLWRSATEARPVGRATLRKLDVVFVETAKISALGDAMVSVDHAWDNLKAAQKAGWTVPADHADIDPPHEALQLQEQFREMARLDSLRSRPAGFHESMQESERSAATLVEALRARPLNAAAADAAFGRTAASCAACHKAYRD